ncbi:hypothetical protein, partial [Escherichia coli]|uniref:hypothetical protein n=2 Tax=Escherichia coli TaxID=562 RepID=UPI001CDAD818
HRALSEHKTLSISWSHYRQSEISFFNDKKSVISCVSDNKHSFKTFRNNQNTGIPLVNIFTYEMNKYWNI